MSKLFKKIDTNKDGNASLKEVNVFFEKRATKHFNPEVAKVIFEKMDKNKDGKVTLNEFIDYYVEGEITLNKRYQSTVKMLAEKVKKREETKDKLREIEKNEVINKHGIMQGSLLKLSILSAKDIKFEGEKETVAELE